MRRCVMRFLLALLLLGCPEQPTSDDADATDAPVPDDDDTAADDDDSADDADTSPDDDDDTPDPCAEPPPVCEGICALHPPVCDPVTGWECTAPGLEATEVSCDGFDNDCDGEVDEDGICPDCSFEPADFAGDLYAAWDIDFDFDCNTYFTSFVSGPDYTVVVPPDPAESSTTYYGNANQNMGWGLVDPDPSNRRVVVTYSCSSTSGCQAQNGLTLLYTCDPGDPNCGCANETNCPGFLDEPFIPSTTEDNDLSINGYTNFASPNGLAVGPRNSYFVGNFLASQCTDAATCIPCGPDEPDAWCSTSADNCCEPEARGRLARFTLPDAAGESTWRTEHVYDGETLVGLATGRDGSVLVGTDAGNVYRWDPVARTSALIATVGGAVLSLTQERPTGDWYLEVQADPKIVRLSELGAPLALPPTVPPTPAGEAALQWGPDGRLWRLQGNVTGSSILEAFEL